MGALGSGQGGCSAPQEQVVPSLSQAVRSVGWVGGSKPQPGREVGGWVGGSRSSCT